MTPTPDEMTQILNAARRGETTAEEELYVLVYDELRQLARGQVARERGKTIQATDLVHEVFLKLLGGQDQAWENRAHFFGAAARAMRQVLVDRARMRGSLKRGGDHQRIEFGEDALAIDESDDSRVLALNRALERLEEIDARKAQIVMLRFFSGLTIEQTAQALGLSLTTVKDEWQFARAWLGSEMTRNEQ